MGLNGNGSATSGPQRRPAMHMQRPRRSAMQQLHTACYAVYAGDAQQQTPGPRLGMQHGHVHAAWHWPKQKRRPAMQRPRLSAHATSCLSSSAHRGATFQPQAMGANSRRLPGSKHAPCNTCSLAPEAASHTHLPTATSGQCASAPPPFLVVVEIAPCARQRRVPGAWRWRCC